MSSENQSKGFPRTNPIPGDGIETRHPTLGRGLDSKGISKMSLQLISLVIVIVSGGFIYINQFYK